MSILRRCVALATVAALAVTVVGCASTPPAVDPAPGTAKGGSPQDAARAFLDAERKHGTLTFTTLHEDGTSDDQKIEYWFDGDRYRLTWFNEDGSVRIHMISPDGEKLYYCRTEDKACEIAYVLPESHQWTFNGPPDWTLDAGVPDGDLTAYTYVAKKLWDVEGASQTFYLEDMVVYANDERIVKTVLRTTSRVPESEADLVTTIYQFDEPELGVEIPADVFELPYEIVQAD